MEDNTPSANIQFHQNLPKLQDKNTRRAILGTTSIYCGRTVSRIPVWTKKL